MEEQRFCQGPQHYWDDVEAHGCVGQTHEQPDSKTHQEQGEDLSSIIGQKVGEGRATTHHGNIVIAGLFPIEDELLPADEIEHLEHEAVQVDHGAGKSIYHHTAHSIIG